MPELLIKKAYVIDPVQRINGEVMDLSIKDGRIVDKVSSAADIIDAKGYLTMAGGIDSHTHVCGTKVNFGRYMSPEDMRAGRTARRGAMYPTSGYTVPTTYGNSYRYSKMGYTTLLEGAMAPMEARHTHEEFLATPMQDMLANTLFDGNWSLFEAVAEKDVPQAAALIGWTLNAVKGFGIKLTNPGGTESWGFGDDISSIDEVVPNWDITPREIIDTSIKACELLRLPHSVHLHCNNLGMPGNYLTTLKTMDIPADLNPDRQTLYLTHLQFHSYGGTTWSDICSEAGKISASVNQKPQIVIDMGQVMFGRTMTMTADGPMEWRLYTLHHDKWSNHDVELETGSGIIPVYYSRKSLVNSTMWAIGLELALLVKDPWQCLLTTDNPNGAPFVKYPEIIGLLMSERCRQHELQKIHPKTTSRSDIGAIDRELSLYEIAVMTRAGQAKALGLIPQGKGHIGFNAVADVAIYPIKPDEIDPTVQYEEVIGAFQQTLYTFKDGVLVTRDGEVITGVQNRTYWVNPDQPSGFDIQHSPRFVQKFSRYYTIDLENYIVQDEYVRRGVVIGVDS